MVHLLAVDSVSVKYIDKIGIWNVGFYWHYKGQLDVTGKQSWRKAIIGVEYVTIKANLDFCFFAKHPNSTN